MSDRSSNGDYKFQQQDADKDKEQVDKAGEYVRELLQEKLELDDQKNPNALRLLDQEIQKTQATGKPVKESKYVDIYREKPIRVTVKVLVPVREHPKFNFVGKLLGPKGNSLKRLQEETMCKMAVLGRGSMKDRQKEEELRNSLDPKYAHLSDELHVEITASAPPAEAYARITFALAEVRKYLIPDNNDNIRQEQMREMEIMGDEMGMPERGPMRPPPAGILRPAVRPGPPVGPPPPRPVPPPSRGGPLMNQPTNRGRMIPPLRIAPPKAKVFSILDRARVAMDQNYGDDLYPPPRHNTYDYEDDMGPHGSHDYYDTQEYPGPLMHQSMKFTEEPANRGWKSYKTPTSSGAPARFRAAPYTRLTK